MPVSKSLSKVSKQKSTSKLHPKGRKLAQLTRAQLRENKLDAKKNLHNAVLDHKLERLKFIQGVCQKLNQPVYTVEDLHDMIRAFIDRNNDEIDQLDKNRRPGRPTTPKHDLLLRNREAEEREYKEGFNVPDITSEDVVKRIIDWKGSIGGTNVFGEKKRLAKGASSFTS